MASPRAEILSVPPPPSGHLLGTGPQVRKSQESFFFPSFNSKRDYFPFLSLKICITLALLFNICNISWPPSLCKELVLTNCNLSEESLEKLQEGLSHCLETKLALWPPPVSISLEGTTTQDPSGPCSLQVGGILPAIQSVLHTTGAGTLSPT